MANIIAGVGLFFLQMLIIFYGTEPFGKYWNPLFIFIISAAIPAYLVWLHLHASASPQIMGASPIRQRLLWALGGLLSVLLAYEEFRKLVVKFSEPEKWSDVITQARVLYERFSQNEFPYTPIEIVGSHTLQPIYMPMHWLPVGIIDLFQIDIRWAGYIVFAIVATLFGWLLSTQKASTSIRIAVLMLPSIVLWAFIIKAPADIMVSFEVVVAAYYLLLASGLAGRKLWVVTLGIILCLLSRYTLFFWIPLFAILLFIEYRWKKSLLVWTTVGAAVLLLFIIPFYLRDPDLIDRGLSHYKSATVGEWIGYGDPPTSWTHENGISIAPHFKALLKGEMKHRVANARMIQGIILLILFGAFLLGYIRWKRKFDIYTYSLIALYCFMFCYYFFAPLTYRYYYFSFLVVSAMVCGKIILFPKQKADPYIS